MRDLTFGVDIPRRPPVSFITAEVFHSLMTYLSDFTIFFGYKMGVVSQVRKPDNPKPRKAFLQTKSHVLTLCERYFEDSINTAICLK